MRPIVEVPNGLADDVFAAQTQPFDRRVVGIDQDTIGGQQAHERKRAVEHATQTAQFFVRRARHARDAICVVRRVLPQRRSPLA